MSEVICNYCGNVAIEHKQSGLYVVDEDHNVIADSISEYYCPTCGETTFSSQDMTCRQVSIQSSNQPDDPLNKANAIFKGIATDPSLKNVANILQQDYAAAEQAIEALQIKLK